MKRLVSILLAAVLVFGLAGSAVANDETDVAKNVMNYSVSMLKVYQSMYQVYGEKMEDTYFRNAYAYLMMAYGAFATLDSEMSALGRSIGLDTSKDYSISMENDILIMSMHDIVKMGDNAYVNYCDGKITRAEFVKTLMERIDRVVQIIDGAIK